MIFRVFDFRLDRSVKRGKFFRFEEKAIIPSLTDVLKSLTENRAFSGKDLSPQQSRDCSVFQ